MDFSEMAQPVDALTNEVVSKQCTETRREIHIYQREVVAKYYDRSYIRDFPLSGFESTVRKVLDYCLAEHPGPVNLFEGGTGTGLFSIPVVDYLFRRDSESTFFGVDNSQPMLNVFFQKPAIQTYQRIHPQRISIVYNDLEQPLGLPQANFDIILLAGVLHCLNDPQSCLRQLDQLLKPGGYLIMVFKTDDFTRMQSGVGYTNSDSDSKYGKFWRQYHELRDKVKVKIDPKCRFVYDVYLAHEIINRLLNKKYCFLKTEQIKWDSIANYAKMIFSIEHGLTFATGQGVDPKLQEKLGAEMKKWAAINSMQNMEILIEHNMEMVVWKKEG